ncbi:DUF4062 domain-containing protein [Aliidiomarina indica]|uniref:DUF4062 domain-containing protein n=1 Tax=Aliidiomarina indica TaxID=2749147 RepID=UPI00188E8321|nr:DUF4062 domain-containing protein [Aliidiomarina indica]
MQGTTPKERLRIFLSSTFQDLQAERDYVNQTLLPQLQYRFKQYPIHLELVDLRWGITELDDPLLSQQGIISSCLSLVKACKPIFLCILTSHSGWVPSQEIIEDIALEYGLPLSELEGISITELECRVALQILHQKPKAYHLIVIEKCTSEPITRSRKALRSALQRANVTPILFSDLSSLQLTANHTSDPSCLIQIISTELIAHIEKLIPLFEHSDLSISEKKFDNDRFIEFRSYSETREKIERIFRSREDCISVHLSGSIGLGKSTFLHYLEKSYLEIGRVALSGFSSFAHANDFHGLLKSWLCITNDCITSELEEEALPREQFDEYSEQELRDELLRALRTVSTVSSVYVLVDNVETLDGNWLLYLTKLRLVLNQVRFIYIMNETRDVEHVNLLLKNSNSIHLEVPYLRIEDAEALIRLQLKSIGKSFSDKFIESLSQTIELSPSTIINAVKACNEFDFNDIRSALEKYPNARYSVAMEDYILDTLGNSYGTFLPHIERLYSFYGEETTQEVILLVSVGTVLANSPPSSPIKSNILNGFSYLFTTILNEDPKNEMVIGKFQAYCDNGSSHAFAIWADPLYIESFLSPIVLHGNGVETIEEKVHKFIGHVQDSTQLTRSVKDITTAFLCALSYKSTYLIDYVVNSEEIESESLLRFIHSFDITWRRSCKNRIVSPAHKDLNPTIITRYEKWISMLNREFIVPQVDTPLVERDWYDADALMFEMEKHGVLKENKDLRLEYLRLHLILHRNYWESEPTHSWKIEKYFDELISFGVHTKKEFSSIIQNGVELKFLPSAFFWSEGEYSDIINGLNQAILEYVRKLSLNLMNYEIRVEDPSPSLMKLISIASFLDHMADSKQAQIIDALREVVEHDYNPTIINGMLITILKVYLHQATKLPGDESLRQLKDSLLSAKRELNHYIAQQNSPADCTPLYQVALIFLRTEVFVDRAERESLESYEAGLKMEVDFDSIFDN